jgi:peptidyl-tRNA hydrolase
MEYSEHQIAEMGAQLIDRDFGYEDEIVQYFLVNSDLKMGKGKVAAQVAHAACICAFNWFSDATFHEWFYTIQKKIILKASEDYMVEMAKLRMSDPKVLAIFDKGYTQIPENSLTVITFGVRPRKEVLQYVEGLGLL